MIYYRSVAKQRREDPDEKISLNKVRSDDVDRLRRNSSESVTVIGD